MVNATFQAVFVYINSFYSGELLALGGNSGVMIYDVSHRFIPYPSLLSSHLLLDRWANHGQFFIGRPLNPTWPGFPNFDIKTFNEDRPGLILWPLLNISCLCEQYVKYGRVTDSMWLVVAFQLFYSADCQWFEVRLPLQYCTCALVLFTLLHGAKLTLGTDIDVDADGHHYRRFRLHALIR